jgi:hypothetical protein
VLAFDPDTPHRVYAIVSDAPASNTLRAYRSEDDGRTWSQTGAAGTFSLIGTGIDARLLRVSEAVPSRWYTVVTVIPHAVRYSRDGGRTWESTSASGSLVYDLALDPAVADNVYAAGAVASSRRGMAARRGCP